MTIRRVLAGIFIAGALLVLLPAAPAAADHYAHAEDDGCRTASINDGEDVFTLRGGKVKTFTDRDGSPTGWICRFQNYIDIARPYDLPELTPSYPDRAVRDTQYCGIETSVGFEFWGEASVLLTPGGVAIVHCRFD